MARRKLIWHIGLAQAPRAVIEANLAAARARRSRRPAYGVVATADEARLATHEILRTHREAGLSRQRRRGPLGPDL